ncbi:MAG: 30S ribosomal protein S3 [Elusimicrobia bacterium]|nr:30S ribosomal protein S3 [Elusimicrobiota bacterium]
MGQKVHPIGYRLGINKDWDSRWFNLKEMPRFIAEDYKIREFIRKRITAVGISKIIIERMGELLRVTIHTDKPGVIIGKGGAEVENIKSEIEDMTGFRTQINIEQIKKPQSDAALIAEAIAQALERKVSFRNIMKKAISRAVQDGVGGIKVAISGRLNGAEIARTEWMKEGRIPLQTIRADIDYGFREANTTYGDIGVKVWVFHGEIHDTGSEDTSET